MPRFMFLARALSMFFLALAADGQQPLAASFPTPSENDFTLHNFHFKLGDLLPEVRMHSKNALLHLRQASKRLEKQNDECCSDSAWHQWLRAAVSRAAIRRSAMRAGPASRCQLLFRGPSRQYRPW